MTDPKSWVATTYLGLADLLAGSALDAWDHPSLCQGWQVRHVVAHMTMPARMTPQDFGIEMAAAGGNFQVLSDKVAARDASLPLTELLDQLRSAQLHEWLPPGGGLAGAVSHAVIHSLDITIAIDRPSVAPTEAEIAVVDQLTEARGALFGVDFNDLQLHATDADRTWGNGQAITAGAGQLVALAAGRQLPDGRELPRS